MGELIILQMQGCVAGYVKRNASPARRHLPGHQLRVLRKRVLLVCKYPQLPGHLLQEALSSAMSAKCSPRAVLKKSIHVSLLHSCAARRGMQHLASHFAYQVEHSKASPQYT